MGPARDDLHAQRLGEVEADVHVDERRLHEVLEEVAETEHDYKYSRLWETTDRNTALNQ